ncbi:PIN domain-containing protein [Gryllotalpicola koreensis]|uniref:Ribonuclease VapC n=1 Tax=Gryllotalpicola koreensis TaxID=993086 RepID=A0ABP8AB27_9MICO
MARLILDTNLLVAAERTGELVGVQPDDDLAVAAISLAEFEVGILAASTRKATARRQALFDEILATTQVLDYTRHTAAAHAALLEHVRESGTPRGAHDLIIAAHARETGRAIASTDRRARFAELPGVTVR